MPYQKARRLVIVASSKSFDQEVIGDWEAEGFEVRFEPVRDGTRASMRSIESIADSLEEGEKYAIVSIFNILNLHYHFKAILAIFVSQR